MKNRFEVELCDTERNEAGLWLQGFTIMDNEAKELVTDVKGLSKFYDLQHYSDVPSYVTKYVTKYVTVYRKDQNYGGPEEGGWYYTSYEPLCSIKVCHSNVESIINLLTENYEITESRDSDLTVIVELSKNSMVRDRPHYE